MEAQHPVDMKAQVQGLLLICFATVPLVVAIAVILPSNRVFSEDAQGFGPAAALGFVLLAAGVAFAQMKLRPTRVGHDVVELRPFKEFRTYTLISLAQIELSAIFGAAIVENRTLSIAMPIAAISAILLGVLPHVLRYGKAVQQ